MSNPIYSNQNSNVINLSTDFQEFAYNTNTLNQTTDTTSFGYGPQGSLFLALQSAACTRTIRFTNQIMPTDILTIEINNPSLGSMWIDATKNLGGLTWSGFLGLTQVNNYDVNVNFARYVYGTTDWSTYSTYRWRVRKHSNGNVAESVLPANGTMTGTLGIGLNGFAINFDSVNKVLNFTYIGP